MLENEQKKLLEMQAELCRTLGHPLRLQIIEMLEARPLPNSELLEHLDIPKANLSQHLGVLEKAGIVKIERDGVTANVSLAMPEVKKACASVRQVLQLQIRRELEAKQKMERILARKNSRL